MKEFKQMLNEVKPKYIVTDQPRVNISGSSDAYHILRKFYDEDTINLQEEFVVLYLNRSNNTVGIYKVSKGTNSACLVDTKMIFAMAMLTGASNMILSHNHPSQSTKPSNDDRKLTDNIQTIAKLMQICVLDHLIITDNTYLSMADEGLIKN